MAGDFCYNNIKMVKVKKLFHSTPDSFFTSRLMPGEKILGIFKTSRDYTHENPLNSVANISILGITIVCMAYSFIVVGLGNDEFWSAAATVLIYFTMLISIGIGIVSMTPQGHFLRRSLRGNFDYIDKNYAVPSRTKTDKRFAHYSYRRSYYTPHIMGMAVGIDWFLSMYHANLVHHAGLIDTSLLLTIVCAVLMVITMFCRINKDVMIAVTSKRVLYYDNLNKVYCYMRLDHPVFVHKDPYYYTITLAPQCESEYAVYEASVSEINEAVSRYTSGNQVGRLVIRGMENDMLLASLIRRTNHKICGIKDYND